MFDSRVLRRIFRLRRDDETGQWRAHSDGLHDLYRCGTFGKQEWCIEGFGGESRVTESRVTESRRMWEGIKMSLQEVGWGYRLD
jgi:hypothetical protein